MRYLATSHRRMEPFRGAKSARTIQHHTVVNPHEHFLLFSQPVIFPDAHVLLTYEIERTTRLLPAYNTPEYIQDEESQHCVQASWQPSRDTSSSLPTSPIIHDRRTTLNNCHDFFVRVRCTNYVTKMMRKIILLCSPLSLRSSCPLNNYPYLHLHPYPPANRTPFQCAFTSVFIHPLCTIPASHKPPNNQYVCDAFPISCTDYCVT